MPLLAADSPLVGGGSSGTSAPAMSDTTQPMQKVRVQRAFLIDGKRIEPGATLDVDQRFAVQLRTDGKVTFVEPEPEPEPAVAPVPAPSKPAAKTAATTKDN